MPIYDDCTRFTIEIDFEVNKSNDNVNQNHNYNKQIRFKAEQSKKIIPKNIVSNTDEISIDYSYWYY